MWNGEKIRVMGVDIEPPYRPENIKSSPDNKALNHIRKIVSITREFNYIPISSIYSFIESLLALQNITLA